MRYSHIRIKSEARATYVSSGIDIASAANDLPAFVLIVCGKAEADAAIATGDQNSLSRHGGDLRMKDSRYMTSSGV